MTNQVKEIIKNYLNTIKLPGLIHGVKTADGIKITENLIVPDDFIYIPSWLSMPPSVGDTLFMYRDLGGQLFFVLDVIKND